MDINFQPDNQNPTPGNEVKKILYLLGGFYEAVDLGTCEDLEIELQKLMDSDFAHTAYFNKMLIDIGAEIRMGTPGVIKEWTGLQVEVVIVYNVLAQCSEAMRTELNINQQWYRVAQASNYLGQLRGMVAGEFIGAQVAGIRRAKSGTDARHRENREMKKEVFEWLNLNMGQFDSMDSAAWKIAGGVVPVVFRTARDWVGQWKKQQNSVIE